RARGRRVVSRSYHIARARRNDGEHEKGETAHPYLETTVPYWRKPMRKKRAAPRAGIAPALLPSSPPPSTLLGSAHAIARQFYELDEFGLGIPDRRNSTKTAMAVARAMMALVSD